MLISLSNRYMLTSDGKQYILLDDLKEGKNKEVAFFVELLPCMTHLLNLKIRRSSRTEIKELIPFHEEFLKQLEGIVKRMEDELKWMKKE